MNINPEGIAAALPPLEKIGLSDGFKQAQLEAGGWTHWNGSGIIRLDPETLVEFELANGHTGKRKARGLEWHWRYVVPEGNDIVRYRIAKTEAPIEAAIKSQADMVNHPPHYADGKVECIDALEAATAGLEGIEAVCTANAIKYLWRWKRKGGQEDLRKARWYINKLLGDV